MKSGKDKQFRAVQRERRLRGDLGPRCGQMTPAGRPGGLALAAGKAPHEADRPWNRAEYFDSEWMDFDESLKDEIAEELDLYDPDTLEVDPALVRRLTPEKIALTGAVHNHLENHIESELDSELWQRIEAGTMSRSQRRRELKRFRNATADKVAQRMAPWLLGLIQAEAGLL